MAEAPNRKTFGLQQTASIGLSVFLIVAPCLGTPSAATPSSINGNGSDYPEVINGVRERAEAQIGKKWIETPDAVLNQRKELEWARYLKTALNLPDWVDLGIENRTRFESLDHPWRSTARVGGGRTDSQIALRSRVRFGLGGNGPVRFLFEGQDSRVYGDEPGGFVNNTTVDEWDILQLFGSLTASNVMGSGLRMDMHFGRMTMDFGGRRYVARNDFRNTTNAFDGFHWQIAKDKLWRFRAFLVEPVIRDEVKLDEQNKNFLFWGAYLENHQIPWMKLNVFYYGLNDQRFANNNLHRTYGTYGLRLFRSAGVGEIDYELEGAVQVGHVGQVDHFAYNPNAQMGYTFDVPWTPRFLVQYTYASGTRTPGGSQSGTFDPLFGARRWDLMATGIFGPFLRSNISSPGWRVIVQPAKGWRIQLKQRFWWLAQGTAVNGGILLQDPTGGAGNYLGHDLEFRVQWVINQNLDFDAGYDHWFKGSYFDRLPASANLPQGGNKDTDYFYISMRVRL
ncbi:MAG: alginate export family protein [Nitrospirales bacterium]|nr:alginate export family protein [Nitrospirales bacterium]